MPLLLAASFLFPGIASGEDATRGSMPPGTSQDGAHPAAGAIQGGSLAPGEQGGMPQKDPAGSAAAGGTAAGAAPNLDRCYQLEGTLREQCLRKEAESPRAPTSAPPARAD
jgi:hypothetical protein